MLLLALSGIDSRAQLFKEWFRQNRTQREYLKEQIAQLKIYLELTKEGYKIAKEGLNTIHQIKSGEFKLHKNRFDSLLIVKSGITSLPRLQHISDLHGSVNEICEKLPARLETCEGLSPEQKKQFSLALTKLYDDCQVLFYGFFAVIRDGQLSMSDEERIHRIEFFYEEFEKNYLFAQDLRRQVGLICEQVKNEINDLENRRALHGLN
ncbi:hypothetical protein J2Y45_006755 [Dyadobacter sp. BE34]|uniref:Uncharacterized protein n=1 Tax=Dyadobacter fermentans TaxID=94254 RepID=A0ABU1R8E1_9BACT|nr:MULTISPECIES: hypothetical protein [Dyadobacter]MDR6809678.1 hypothetical protein [Dyadobacter fermentans]MDR7047356.1 hypothetical protein [Dyadobacter sp. BE242]MDR7201591.1 hypothetical protein [Dyadobacter sp. BE34]MDR7219461.1 hypothetical protein [Dyadobacter sp. BE31]MDR7267144.1 hypothetical protein [Dyadobacter sp. BE32]